MDPITRIFARSLGNDAKWTLVDAIFNLFVACVGAYGLVVTWFVWYVTPVMGMICVVGAKELFSHLRRYRELRDLRSSILR